YGQKKELRIGAELAGAGEMSAAVSDGGEAAIEALLSERAAARGAKNFARADEIRNELAAMGVVIEDTPQGAKWKRA
ncbi:MAG: cysteine--tRNA ligase, partial [Oscillospiraceae bacterium]|nr:cysteine--tRNA ligase [Oscillospiraceae bacterium]